VPESPSPLSATERSAYLQVSGEADGSIGDQSVAQ